MGDVDLLIPTWIQYIDRCILNTGPHDQVSGLSSEEKTCG